jgi:hypothetical protein
MFRNQGSSDRLDSANQGSPEREDSANQGSPESEDSDSQGSPGEYVPLTRVRQIDCGFR